jgi:hypothetical protein
MINRARANGDARRLITGYFDPLLASHARQLDQIASQNGLVTVLLRTPPSPLLDARARAELVAALASVETVVLPPEEGDPETPGTRIISDEVAETERFIEHVRSRH